MPSKKILSREEQELYNELKKLSKRANQRIVRLEREFGKDTWATKYLKEKLATEPLQAWTLSGRVKVNKSMTVTQMQATIKFTKEFLNSSISTKRGIKKAKQKAIKTLKTRFSTDVSEISYEEAEVLTHFFDDKEVNGITNYIKGSDVLAIIEEAREKNFDYETFSNIMNGYIIYNKGKGNIESILRKIYIKYVYKGNTEKSEVDMLYNNFESTIDLANTQTELDEIESIVEDLLQQNKINEKEYTYLINKINDKRKEL
jgi:hypothetical protein